MPRVPRADPDRALADLIVARWRLADEARAPRVKVWDQSYKDHDPAFIDRQVVTRPPYVKYPCLDRVRVSQTSMIVEATEGGARWMWAQHLSPDEDSRRRSEMATEYLEWNYYRPAETVDRTNRAASKRVAQMGLTYGDAYFLVRYRDGRVRWESVSPYDMWQDARYGEWFVILRYVTLARLFDIAEGLASPNETIAEDPETGEPMILPRPPRDGGRALRVAKKIERSIREGFSQGTFSVRAWATTDLDRRYDTGRVSGDPVYDRETGIRPDEDPFNFQVAILEYHETNPKGIVSIAIPGFADSDPLVFQKETNPYGACPIVKFSPRPVDNEQYGIGNGEAAGGPARALDYNFRGALAMIGAHAWPALLNTRRSNLRRNFLGSLYGLVVDVDDTQRDLAYLTPPAIGPGLHQMGMQIGQIAADVGTGEGAKDPVRVGQARNATTGAILESYGSKADQAILDNWIAAMEQLAHVTMAVAKVHVTETQLIPVLGRRTPGFVEMRPELFEGPWYFRFGGSTRVASQAIATQLNIAQTYAASGELDVRESLREVYRLAGERDPERFLRRKDEALPVEPRREHLMILDGQMPTVSAREDLARHWQEHAVQLQNWSRAMPPNDPRFQRLQIHLTATQIAWQAQSAAMAQPQGSTPAMVAGGAGQPMVPVSGMDQMRQMSNVRAAGQAPGPTGSVPGRTVGEIATGGGAR